MLNKKIIIAGFFLSFSLAIGDFFAFKINPRTFFFIHNFLSLLVGIVFIYSAKKLIAKKSGKSYINFLILISGLGMVAVHATKIIIGKCI